MEKEKLLSRNGSSNNDNNNKKKSNAKSAYIAIQWENFESTENPSHDCPLPIYITLGIEISINKRASTDFYLQFYAQIKNMVVCVVTCLTAREWVKESDGEREKRMERGEREISDCTLCIRAIYTIQYETKRYLVLI